MPLIAWRDQNVTHAGNATNTKHAETPKSSGTGLGSDPVDTSHSLSHNKHFFESTYGYIKAFNFGRRIRQLDPEHQQENGLVERPTIGIGFLCKDCSRVARQRQLRSRLQWL